MNISFITRSSTSPNRHMLEHLMLYRSKGFLEATSFYKYLYKNNIVIDFKTLYDYMEISFYGVNLEIVKNIENALRRLYTL